MLYAKLQNLSMNTINKLCRGPWLDIDRHGFHRDTDVKYHRLKKAMLQNTGQWLCCESKRALWSNFCSCKNGSPAKLNEVWKVKWVHGVQSHIKTQLLPRLTYRRHRHPAMSQQQLEQRDIMHMVKLGQPRTYCSCQWSVHHRIIYILIGVNILQTQTHSFAD